MEREFGVPIRVRAGAPGSLTVLLDGERVYSKNGRHSANPAEIIQLVRAKISRG